MIDILTIVGGLILAALGFTAKFIGSLCLIALALIVFTILFLVLILGGFAITNTILDIVKDKYSVFEKEVTDYEERNTDTHNG